MKLIIKDSKFGKGSFAPTDIKAGTKILTFQGKLVDGKEINRRIENGEERLDDPLQIGNDSFLDLNDDSYYINHSCDPNTVLSGIADLIALKDIKKGEEIAYDYSSSVGVGIDVNWQMDCGCKSSNCRKKIGNVLSIPKDQLEKYHKAGGLQNYIRRQLNLK